jgi:hypothetical protein
MEDRGPYASASILPSIAATLLPLLLRYADIPRLTLPFAPPTPIGALVRRAATLTLLGLRTKLLATDRSESGFYVGGYQDRVGRVGGEEQIRRVLCKPELFSSQNAKGNMVA